MSAPDVHVDQRQESTGARGGAAVKSVPRATPERSVDVITAERERERQARWMVVGVSVALAVIVPIARQLWRWLREERIRAKVDREILRELNT